MVGSWSLNAETEVYVLFVAGVGVEVVGGAVVEAIALAEFASDEEAESYSAEAGGDPADGLDEGRFFFFLFIVPILPVARKGKGAGDGGVVCLSVWVAGCGAELHDLDDSPGASGIGGTVVIDEMLLSCHLSSAFLTLSVRKGCIKLRPLFDTKRASSLSGFDLRYVDLFEPQAVEEGGDGGAGVFAGGVEDAVGERGGLELLLGLGAGVGFEVLVDGDEEAGGAGVDAGVLVVDGGDEELGWGEGDLDRLA